MIRNVIVVLVAVVVALGAAQQLMKLSAARASAPLPAVAQATGPDAPDAVPAAPPPDAAEVAKATDGHYWAEAQVNGRWIHCLIDTGASTVALTLADAERLGLDPAALTYDQPVNTANGQTSAARVELDSVSVAGARVDAVPALVVRAGLSTSLLGMSYLGKLSRFEATRTSLILRP